MEGQRYCSPRCSVTTFLLEVDIYLGLEKMAQATAANHLIGVLSGKHAFKSFHAPLCVRKGIQGCSMCPHHWAFSEIQSILTNNSCVWDTPNATALDFPYSGASLSKGSLFFSLRDKQNYYPILINFRFDMKKRIEVIKIQHFGIRKCNLPGFIPKAFFFFSLMGRYFLAGNVFSIYLKSLCLKSTCNVSLSLCHL